MLARWGTADCHGYLLKGNFVGVDVARRVVRSGNVVGSRGPLPRGALGGAAAAAVEELHVVGDDLGRAPLLAILAFPRTRLDASLNKDEGALARVLGHDLREISLAG